MKRFKPLKVIEVRLKAYHEVEICFTEPLQNATKFLKALKRAFRGSFDIFDDSDQDWIHGRIVKRPVQWRHIRSRLLTEIEKNLGWEDVDVSITVSEEPNHKA